MASTVGVKNPYRYRGYRFDTETGWYYLQSRYYDPDMGRFINADGAIDTIAAAPQSLTNKNLFAYCDNSPVLRADNDGDAWFLAPAIVGFVVGIIGQVISDATESLLTGKEFKFSSWQTYVGAGVGGAAGGMALALTGSPAIAGAVSGGLTTLVGQGLEKITNKDYDKTWEQICVNTAIDAGMGALLGKIPGPKGVTHGRGSMQKNFFREAYKLRNNLITKFTNPMVVAKGGIAMIAGGVPMDLYYGYRQSIRRAS